MFEDFLKKNAPTPWVNLIADEKDDEVKINMWNRQYTVGKNCLLSSIISGGEEMLDAVLSLIPLDTYADENLLLMQTTNGDPTPTIWDKYFEIAKKHDDNLRAGNVERFAFYERAKNAYAVIATGEGAIYANVIIKKGVIK